jgi:hypothetical protein
MTDAYPGEDERVRHLSLVPEPDDPCGHDYVDAEWICRDCGCLLSIPGGASDE